MFLGINDIASITKAAADSTARAVLLDTTGKSEAGKNFIARIQAGSELSTEQILGNLASDVISFGLKVLLALLIYVLGAYLIKLLKRFLRKIFEKRNTEKAIVSFTLSLVSTASWVMLIIVVVGTLGVETTSIAALLAAGGMAIGMALSGTVQNFAGGIMILVFKPFKVGDYIEAQGFAGTVTEMNITSCKLTTVDNRVIILPNGALSSGSVNNYSKMEFRRVDFSVSVEYGSEADKVKELLLGIAAADSRVLSAASGAPADAFAGLSKLSSSSVDFTLRVWVKTVDYWPVFFDLNEEIYKCLPENGINFPFPQLSIHLPSARENL